MRCTIHHQLLCIRILHFDNEAPSNDSAILNHDPNKRNSKGESIINQLYQGCIKVVCTLLRIRSCLSTSFALHSTLLMMPSNVGLNHEPRPKGEKEFKSNDNSDCTLQKSIQTQSNTIQSQYYYECLHELQ